ncbi:AAA family ATPase [Nocardia carnea]|uniref:AAA family ATPase n=1 Tax=Nocardia carnea TaxID=37328 RepID=UPI0024542836|nr:LuxR family transcriptional regulator [Nocardia carnea]
MDTNVGIEWPLVERDTEIGECTELITRGGSLVVAGPAGVGKTRLAAELRKHCEQAGAATVWITGSSAASSVPLGAFAATLPSPDPASSTRVEAVADLIRRTAAALVDASAPRRLVLFIDDAHRLDPVSATLVHQLVVRGAASVVVTLRTGEEVHDTVTALWKDGLAHRRELRGISPVGIAELLRAALPGPIDPGTVTQFSERSGGNALFLRELVIAALERGALRNDGGIWRLRGEPGISERLAELIGARLCALSADELLLLEVVAVGEPLGVEELRELGDPLVAEQLERKKFLVTSEEGQDLMIRFAHPLYGEVVRSRMGGLRRRLLARSLAEVAEQSGAQHHGDLLRIAIWRLEGGGGTAEQMLSAARMARWRYDFPLAQRLATAACARGAGFPAALLAAQLASLQGRGDDAERQFAELAEQVENDAQRAAVALSRIDNVAFYLGQPDAGIAIAREAEIASADAVWRGRIQARRSALVFSVEGPRAGAAVAAPLLDRSDGNTLAWAAQVAAFTFGRLGRIQAGMDATVRGFLAHRRSDEPLDWYPWTHLFFRCEILSWSGRFEEARTLADEHYVQALHEHSAEAQAWFAWFYASVVGEQGDVVASERHGREAVALFHELGRPQFMAFVLPYLAEALALSGRAAPAAETLRELDMLRTSDHFMGVDPLQARAWTAVASGDLPAGRDLLGQAAAKAEAIGDFVGRASALHGLARLGCARDVHRALAEEAERIEGDLVRARAAHAAALARRDVAGLMAASAEFERMAAHLLAAEAAADAAVALRRTGDRRRITAAERQARELAQRCPEARTPALAQIDSPAVLTRGERDAAMLAAAGRSNKEIAAELHLSVRTVEGRLLRAYTRLGVGNRRELAAVLGGDNRPEKAGSAQYIHHPPAR